MAILSTLGSSWTWDDFWWSTNLYYQLLFFVDTIWALFGYCAESRWFGNKTKSVEPTGLAGWWPSCATPPTTTSAALISPQPGRTVAAHHDPGVLAVFKVLTLVAFTIYVWATLAFGPTFSNLTNRGIVTRGPYASSGTPPMPARTLRGGWNISPIGSPGNGYFPHNLLALVVWNIIYGLRAWTEERHLSQDPAYREYKKKVRWGGHSRHLLNGSPPDAAAPQCVTQVHTDGPGTRQPKTHDRSVFVHFLARARALLNPLRALHLGRWGVFMKPLVGITGCAFAASSLLACDGGYVGDSYAGYDYASYVAPNYFDAPVVTASKTASGPPVAARC